MLRIQTVKYQLEMPPEECVSGGKNIFESTFITSLTAAPCQKSCTLRFAAVFFKKETGSNLNPNIKPKIFVEFVVGNYI